MRKRYKDIGFNKDVLFLFDLFNEQLQADLYLVGGAVRDILLNKEIKDYDFATNLTPEEIMDIFKDSEEIKIIPTGIKHGTVTLRYKESNYEITTYRTDGNYSDNRRPDCVKYVRTIEEDLARRDFTINAIAFNPNTGFIDPFKGIEHLVLSKLFAVRNADERLQEDYLRALRAIRFCAKYNMELDSEVRIAILKNKNLIKFISKERIFDEVSKILLLNPSLELLKLTFLVIFNESEVIGAPSLSNKMRKTEIYSVESDFKLAMCWSQFLDGIPNLTKTLKDLRMPSKLIKEILCISEFRSHLSVISTEDVENYNDLAKNLDKKYYYQLKTAISDIKDLDLTRAVLTYYKLTSQANEVVKSYRVYLELLDIIIKEKHSIFVKDLNISGKDVEDLCNEILPKGYRKDIISRTLETLINYVRMEKDSNNKESLTSIARYYITKELL